ncbi:MULTISPECIES: hypothetical protein [Halobacterium]|uniref:DUF7346 family protein n=1 Tax=Halobacterium TaxID=2239 RepID=UPI00073E6C04|nr:MULTISPECIES: hypothetical protein [Halobacterium]MCG1002562.1 hypothetical protein [Halobacterium noricense]
MRTVRDDDGHRYLLLKQSSDSSLVRDPETGDERHLPNDNLEPVDGEAPLTALASAVPEPARRVVAGCHDDWHLGLLVDLADRGPLAAREMLGAYDACESDFLGGVTELRAAGLLEEATVNGERGYRLTETGEAGIERLRD